MVLLKFVGRVLWNCYHMIMHCILFHYNHIFMHSRIVCLINQCECCSLDWVFAHDANCFERHMLMHFHALHFSFSLSWASSLLCCFSSFSSLLVFWLWHPRNLHLWITRSLIVVLHLLLLFPLLLIEFDFVMWTPKRILLRTSVTRRFIQNAKSFCLIFQTLFF